MFYLYVLFSASAVNSFDNEWEPEPNTTSICSFSQKKKNVTKSVSLLFS